MIKNIEAIEKALKLEAGTLKGAIDSKEEVEIGLPELVIRTKEEEEQHAINVDAEKKERYDAGKEKGVKDTINEHLETFGISLEGKAKTIENFADAFKEKVIADAKIEPNKKIETLEKDKQELQKSFETVSNEFNTFKSEVEKKETLRATETEIFSAIPEGDYNIPLSDVKTLVKTKTNTAYENGMVVFLDDKGEVMKDSQRNPLKAADIVPEIAKPYLKTVDGGAGDDDEAGQGKPGTYESFVKEMENKGISEGSEEFSKESQKRIKDGTLVV